MSHSRSSGPVPPASQVIVPLVPDVQSIASIARAEELSGMLEEGQSGRNLFVLNRFDEARALHREIRTYLEKLLGDRLIPEALSLGMTVLDHAPQAAVVRDFAEPAAWLEVRVLNARQASAERVEIA